MTRIISEDNMLAPPAPHVTDWTPSPDDKVYMEQDTLPPCPDARGHRWKTKPGANPNVTDHATAMYDDDLSKGILSRCMYCGTWRFLGGPPAIPSSAPAPAARYAWWTKLSAIDRRAWVSFHRNELLSRLSKIADDRIETWFGLPTGALVDVRALLGPGVPKTSTRLPDPKKPVVVSDASERVSSQFTPFPTTAVHRRAWAHEHAPKLKDVYVRINDNAKFCEVLDISSHTLQWYYKDMGLADVYIPEYARKNPDLAKAWVEHRIVYGLGGVPEAVAGPAEESGPANPATTPLPSETQATPEGESNPVPTTYFDESSSGATAASIPQPSKHPSSSFLKSLECEAARLTNALELLGLYEAKLDRRLAYVRGGRLRTGIELGTIKELINATSQNADVNDLILMASGDFTLIEAKE